MDEKKYDALMRQAEFHINLFNERRKHSWQVTLVFWAALLGTTGYLLKENIPEISICVIVLVGLIFNGLYIYFFHFVFNADKKDKMVAFKARDLAIDMIAEKELIEVRAAYTIGTRKFFEDKSAIFQIAVTIMLTVIAGVMLVMR